MCTLVFCHAKSATRMLEINPTSYSRTIYMSIGIVGAGHIGGTLTRRLSAVGHKVLVCALEPLRTADLEVVQKHCSALWSSICLRNYPATVRLIVT